MPAQVMTSTLASGNLQHALGSLVEAEVFGARHLH